jgi:hypothetical protein
MQRKLLACYIYASMLTGVAHGGYVTGQYSNVDALMLAGCCTNDHLTITPQASQQALACRFGER